MNVMLNPELEAGHSPAIHPVVGCAGAAQQHLEVRFPVATNTPSGNTFTYTDTNTAASSGLHLPRS